MSNLVERIKAVEDAFKQYSLGGCYRPLPNDALAAIAAALAEAEKVDERNKWLEGANTMLLRPTTNYCEVCAKRDAAFQRAREAFRRRGDLVRAAFFAEDFDILDDFFGGVEGGE